MQELLIESKYEDVDLLDWTHLDTWFEDEEEKKAAPEQPEHLYADFTIAKGYSTNPALNGFQLHSLNVEAVVDGKTYVFKSINPNDVKLPASIFGEGDIFSLSTGTRHFPAVLPVTENYEEVTEGAFWLTQYDEENDTLVANILVLIKWGEGFFGSRRAEEEKNQIQTQNLYIRNSLLFCGRRKTNDHLPFLLLTECLICRLRVD